jgi:DNA polymerase elongation subunit (family B)
MVALVLRPLNIAYARRSLTQLRKIASKEFGLREIYSDTDSIFLQGFRDGAHFEQFQQACANQLVGLELEPKLLERFLLIDSKSYIAKFQEKGKIVIERKGLQGLKSDAPKWIKQTVEQFVVDYVDNKNEQIISNVKNAYEDMLVGKVPRELLKIQEKVNQDPQSYKNENNYLPRLAKEQQISQGGQIQYFYGIGGGDGEEEEDGRPETNPKEISIDKYLEIFETALAKLLYNYIAVEINTRCVKLYTWNMPLYRPNRQPWIIQVVR